MTEDGFMVGWDYQDGISAFFEDDLDTGWFYLAMNGKIRTAQHIYNVATQKPEVRAEHVNVVRSENGDKVGVVIWGEFRGIINVKTGETFKDNRGITDEEWLNGFNYNLKPDSDGVPRAFVP